MVTLEQVASVEESNARLEFWRKEKAMEAKELCRRAGIGPATYSSWITKGYEGGWRLISAVVLALGKTPNDLQLRDACTPAAGKPLTRQDHEARLRIMAVLERLEDSGKALAPVVARFLEEIADELLRQSVARYPAGTVIEKPEPGVKLLTGPQVARKIKRSGAQQAGERQPRYGKKKRRA